MLPWQVKCPLMPCSFQASGGTGWRRHVSLYPRNTLENDLYWWLPDYGVVQDDHELHGTLHQPWRQVTWTCRINTLLMWLMPIWSHGWELSTSELYGMFRCHSILDDKVSKHANNCLENSDVEIIPLVLDNRSHCTVWCSQTRRKTKAVDPSVFITACYYKALSWHTVLCPTQLSLLEHAGKFIRMFPHHLLPSMNLILVPKG
jgi:hypothetical protein